MKPRVMRRLLLLGLFGLVIMAASGALASAEAEGGGAEPAVSGAKPPQKQSSLTGSGNFKPNAGGVQRFKGILGYLMVLMLGYLFSTNRRDIRWRPVIWGLVLQLCFALIVLNPVVGQVFFDGVDRGVRALLSFAEAGIEFLFQSTDPHQMTHVGPGGQMVTETYVGRMSPALKSVAFWVLPTVIFFSSLITLLYHLGVMQWIVRGIARAMVYMLGTSGAETLSCTANIFVGQTEAPLLVKPFINEMTMSELMAVMTGGFATVAGGVLAIYVGMLKGLTGIAGHLVTASLMAAPCALAVSKLLYPETGEPSTGRALKVDVERPDTNAIEAAARGAAEGMTLVLNIAAMLVAFVGLMALVNALLGVVGLSVQQLLGWVLSPLAWAIGAPWDEATLVGQMLGEKLVLTELIAYLSLKKMLGAPQALLSQRSAIISSYALCGFANVASIGIQIGGIGGIAPRRRADLARLGIRAMLAGAMVSCLSGAIAGILAG